MSEDMELPGAEDTEEVMGDGNAKAKQRKLIVGGVLVAGVLALTGTVAWNMFADPPARPADDETSAKILTTARVATGSGQKRGEAAAEELKVRVEQLDAQISEVNQERGVLSMENERLKAELEADRANALRTIAVLERSGPGAGATIPQQPVQSASPQLMVAGEATGPRGGPDPFGGAGGGPRGGGYAGEEARPRRALNTVRMGESGGATPASTRSSNDRDGGSSGSGGSTQFMSPAGQVFDSRNYVPPNAYAPARVLVGVDAQTGVTTNSDPKPVLFRLTGPAVHVGANGRYQTTDLTGCMVNGAAYGELSSEKVYIRLQRITCPAGEGRFSVATVEGYASHRGKAGVRGNVITREGGLTSRAFVAGTLSGLGNSLSQYTNSLNRNIGIGEGGMLSSPQLNPGDLAAGSLGSGVGGAAGVLSDYFVKRAEQYQPVIEMPTGIEVELVLLTGFQLERPAPARRR